MVTEEKIIQDNEKELLLKRAFAFLSDGEFNKADEYCERVLDRDLENAQAYLGKLMAELKIKNIEDLKAQKRSFKKNKNYQKIMLYGDDEIKGMLDECTESVAKNVKKRKKRAKIAGISVGATAAAGIGAGALATVLTIVTVILASIVLVIGISLSAIFIGYPMVNYALGNYDPLINMYHLQEFTVPDGVTEINGGAFEGCESLKKLTIPDSVTYIAEGALKDCQNLESITIPFVGRGKWSDSYESHFGYIFGYEVSNENDYNYHYSEYHSNDDGSYTYTYYTYYIPSSLKHVTVSGYCSNIGDQAFRKCSSLTSITIPSSVTYIGSFAFSGCYNLIQKENGVSYVGKWAIDCDTSVTTVTLRNNTVGIAENAFFCCSNLKSITIPNSITSIGEWAFYGCSSLASVTIPDSVTSIGEWTFCDCSSLTRVTIPDSVTRIGENAFSDCSSLKTVYYTGTQSEWKAITIDSWGNGNLKNADKVYNYKP